MASTRRFKPVTHVIFDMDGLLLDTEDIYTRVFQELVAPYGKTFDWSIKAKMMGMKPEQGATYLIEKLELPMTEEYYHEWTANRYAELMPTAELLPGAEKLVRHLHKHKVPIGLSTGSDVEKFNTKTTNHREFFKLFDPLVTCGSDPEVKHGKPHADAFLVPARRFPDRPDPSQCLAFEDSPNGVESAVNAGMQVVMVPHPSLDRSLCKGGTLVINSLEEFCPEEFGLPAYES